MTSKTTIKTVFPICTGMTAVALPFVIIYANPSFLLGAYIGFLIFATILIVLLVGFEGDDDDLDVEETKKADTEVTDVAPRQEERQGLTFYLRCKCIEVRTQDGRSYRWATGKDGLNYMVDGTLNSGIYHSGDKRAYIEFWSGDNTYHFDPVNPWETSADSGLQWVKDFQEVK